MDTGGREVEFLFVTCAREKVLAFDPGSGFMPIRTPSPFRKSRMPSSIPTYTIVSKSIALNNGILVDAGITMGEIVGRLCV